MTGRKKRRQGKSSPGKSNTTVRKPGGVSTGGQNAVFLVSLVLIGLHAFVVYLLPDMASGSFFFLKRSWGFHFWTFYPAIMALSCYAVAIAASVPVVNQAVGARIENAAVYLSRQIRNRPLIYSGLCILSWTIFYLGRQKYGFLGDGYVRASDVAAGRIASEGTGSLHVLVLLQGWLGNWDNSGVSSLRFFSVFWGGPYVVLVCIWANCICSRQFDKVTCAALMIFIGPVQYFFGYIETYAPLPVFSVGFLLAGITALRGDRPPLWATLFFAAGAFMHILLVLFSPAFLYLWAAYLYPRFSLFRDHRAVFLSAGGGGLLLLVYFVGKEYANVLLPLIPAPEQPYALLSAWHAWEWINAQVLSAPMGWPLLMLVALAGSRVLCREIRFLAAGALGMLAGLFAIDPVLGSRDWDILCLSGVPLMALATCRMYNGGVDRYLVNYASVLSVVLAALLTVPWVHINHTDRSVSRVNRILEGDPGSYYVNHPMELTLGSYFSKAGLHPRAIEQWKKGIKKYPSEPKMLFNLGNEYLLQGDFRKAVPNLLRALDLFPDYKHPLRAMIFVLSKDPESIPLIENHFFSQADSSTAERKITGLWSRLGRQAMEQISQHADSSAAERTIAELWSRLGHQEMEKGNYDTAIQIYRNASMLGSHKALFLHGLGVAYFKKGDLENAISSLEKSHHLAPENEQILSNLERIREIWSGTSSGESPMRPSATTGPGTARTE